jgi:hypothetical protein
LTLFWWFQSQKTIDTPEKVSISPPETKIINAKPVPVPQVIPPEPIIPIAPKVLEQKSTLDDKPENVSTSSDGIVQLQTSKPVYKNGEAFKLNFTLAKPMYVRLLDRDNKGVITKLRPNAIQVDKLLEANKDFQFPPKGITTPVNGIAGRNSVTIIASEQAFPKNINLLAEDGSVSEEVLQGHYSWTQVYYSLHP